MTKKINTIKYVRKFLNLKLHEKIRLFDRDLPIEKIFKIPSSIVFMALTEKDNKFYLELGLSHCLYEI